MNADRRMGAWLKTLRSGEDGRDWWRLVWVDFIGLCAVAALGAALITLAG